MYPSRKRSHPRVPRAAHTMQPGAIQARPDRPIEGNEQANKTPEPIAAGTRPRRNKPEKPLLTMREGASNGLKGKRLAENACAGFIKGLGVRREYAKYCPG